MQVTHPDLELTAAELIAEHTGNTEHLNADAVADENRDANVGRWTSWAEREGAIPFGAPVCGATTR